MRPPKDLRSESEPHSGGGRCTLCTQCARRLVPPYVEINVAEAPDEHTAFLPAAELCSYACLAAWATGRPEEYRGKAVQRRLP